MQKSKLPKIIVPASMRPKPSTIELEIAEILVIYFNKNVYFVEPTITAKKPDIKIGQTYWEIKSPIGNGKNTIRHQFKRASYQCSNLVLDLRFIKLNQEKAISYSKYNFDNSKTISNLIIITKTKNILAYSKKI